MTPSIRVCKASDVREDQILSAEEDLGLVLDDAERDYGSARDLMLSSYEVPRFFYKTTGAAKLLASHGALLNYWHHHPHTGRRKRPRMDIDALVARWKPVIVGLATAHDKDEADRFESQLNECLSPILTAPIRDVREFARRLVTALKEDPAVPFLVWRAYEIWVSEFVAKAGDGDLITLKADIAQEIAALVEEDLKPQLSTALVHALQWRSPEKLQQVKAVAEQEKAAGRPARLRGRESCLFLEMGGTEEKPEVVVQI